MAIPTQLLSPTQQDDLSVADELLPLVYNELRKLAAAKMAHEKAGQTLQPTALVHEAWIRLSGDEEFAWHNRPYFFASAAEAMRRILIERARRKIAARRAGFSERIELAEFQATTEAFSEDVLAVHEALECLERWILKQQISLNCGILLVFQWPKPRKPLTFLYETRKGCGPFAKHILKGRYQTKRYKKIPSSERAQPPLEATFIKREGAPAGWQELLPAGRKTEDQFSGEMTSSSSTLKMSVAPGGMPCCPWSP